MRVKAARLVKVRNSICVLTQIMDDVPRDKIVEFDDLPEEDQKDAGVIAKTLIELFDGLTDRGGKRS